MEDCIFCKIVAGNIPADVVYEDDEILAFRDLEPQAPVHVLIIPKRHISSLDELTESTEDRELAGSLFTKVHVVAEKLGLERGYRTVVNTGEDGLQTVLHLHLHLLGGRKMGWPPG